jgi:F-type H+-transporting ATPase subunit delta
LEGSIVARRYAKSLVLAADDEGELRALFDEFRTVLAQLTVPELAEIWRNPGISVERKVKLVQELTSRFEASRKFASFLSVLAAKNRIRLLTHVFEEFSNLARARLGEITVIVETPFDLTEEEKNDLSSILRRKLGKKIILEIRKNAGLIAGMLVRIGDRVIDGSLKMKIEKLGQSISA